MPLYPAMPAAEQPVVQARRTTAFTLGAAFADIDLDTKDIENDTTVIAYTAPDSVTVKVAGKYGISYAATAPGSAQTTSLQVRKNDAAVLPGSLRAVTTAGTDAENISCYFVANLAANDFVTLQGSSSAGTPDLAIGVTLVVVHLAGQKGETGAASATDVDAIHKSTGGEIATLGEKLVSAGNDLLIIEDSADSNNKKKLKIGNLPGGLVATSTAPVNVTKAAAAVGLSADAARGDHKHDVTTAAPVAGAVVVNGSAVEGSATSLARSDHVHTVTAAAPTDVGAANAAGSAATFVHSDHVHAGLSRNANDFASFAAKSVPLGADLVLIEDSAAGGVKKQATLSALPGALYGLDFQSAVDETTTTTSSVTYGTKVSLITPALTGMYRVEFYCGVAVSNVNRRVQVHLYNATDAVELCSDDLALSTVSVFRALAGFAFVTFAGAAKTFQLQFASPQTGVVYCRRARIEFWRVS